MAAKKRIKAEVVSDKEWSRNFRRYSPMWAEFEEPFRLLSQGHRVKISAGNNPELLRKHFMQFAYRAELRLASAISKSGEWIYFCPKFDGWKNHAKERVQKSNQPKGETTQHSELNNQRGPLTSRGRSLNSEVGQNA
jgi:hypothetical protein